MRIRELQSQVENLAEAIATGGLHGSRGLATRLQATEAELEGLQAAPAPPTTADIELLLPQLGRCYDDLVANLEQRLESDEVPALRQELGRVIGPIRVRLEGDDVVFESEADWIEKVVFQASALRGHPQQISVVAGAGFEPATFGL
jgi:hypothetical protein